MRVLRCVLLCVALIASSLPALAAPPVFTGSVTVPPGGKIDSTSNPILPGSGGIGPFQPLNIPSSATIVFVGDSITYGGSAGLGGATSCVRSGVSPNGTCFADVVTAHYGATEVNKGLVGSCVETTATGGSTCNTVASLISRYTTDVIPYAGNNSNYFVFLYGANDAGHNDPAVSVATFEANYNTVIQAVINAGTLPSHIIIGAIPYSQYTTAPDAQGFGSPQPVLMKLNAAVARVAVKNGTLYARDFEALAECGNNWLSTASTNSCMYDTLHPLDAGHAAIAKSIYVADYQSAVISEAAFDAAVAITNNPQTYNIMSTTFGSTNRLGVGSTFPQNAGRIGVAAPGNTHNGLIYFGQENADGALQYTGGVFYFTGGPVSIGQSSAPLNLNAYGFAQVGISAQAIQAGDISCSRNSAPTSCYIFFGTNANGLQYYDGTNFHFNSPVYSTTFNGSNWAVSSTLCTDASKNTITGCTAIPPQFGHNTCSANSGNPCSATVTCSLAPATTCSATATVPTTSSCNVTANGSDTTTGVESFKASLSTNTLTVTATVAASQTSTVAANVNCL